MSWIITPELRRVDGVPIGTFYGGGYVAGFISHTADGVPTHALIVAPRETGATGTGYPLATALQWKTSQTTTPDTYSLFDGVANTAAMVAEGIANFPAANFCVNLGVGGFADWYLPSLLELDIAYFNLKPNTISNVTNKGINNYSVPQRTANYTVNYPSQTSLINFQGPSGLQRFEGGNHWSSTEVNAANSSIYILNNGDTGGVNKATTSWAVRAFRRITL